MRPGGSYPTTATNDFARNRKARTRIERIRRNMKCEELLKAINDYVDGQIDPAICDELEHHLADCNPCQVVVDNIRQTIRLYKAGQPYELPPEFCSRLRSTLHERWKLKFEQTSEKPQQSDSDSK